MFSGCFVVIVAVDDIIDVVPIVLVAAHIGFVMANEATVVIDFVVVVVVVVDDCMIVVL